MKVVTFSFIFLILFSFVFSIKNEEKIQVLSELIKTTDKILIGAGAGLSSSAGLDFSGKERFHKYFFDFEEKYKIRDMYSGSFYQYKTKNEYWAFMSRNMYLNRYDPIPKNTYELLLKILKNKNYFVLTTNCDHCFQKAGFDKNRLYYMQGDMGLIQCKKPCHNKNYENYDILKEMLINQGFQFDKDGKLFISKNVKSYVDDNLIPKCPKCGGEMDFNLRVGEWFVEDEGWKEHKKLYINFLNESKGSENILLIELGVGYNTPSIIKYPFWNYIRNNKNAKFVSINLEKENIPKDILKRSLIINGDIHEILEQLTYFNYKSDL